MDAEKLAMQRRIDTLDQHAVKLHAALTEAERENARLKAELEKVKRERAAAVERYKRVKENANILSDAVTQLEHERDALMFDFKGYVKKPKKACSLCKNRTKPICNMCEGCDVFEWRGLCAENGGVKE